MATNGALACAPHTPPELAPILPPSVSSPARTSAVGRSTDPDRSSKQQPSRRARRRTPRVSTRLPCRFLRRSPCLAHSSLRATTALALHPWSFFALQIPSDPFSILFLDPGPFHLFRFLFSSASSSRLSSPTTRHRQRYNIVGRIERSGKEDSSATSPTFARPTSQQQVTLSLPAESLVSICPFPRRRCFPPARLPLASHLDLSRAGWPGICF